MNSFWERPAITIVTANDSGIVTTEIRARSGLIQSIIPRTPTTVSTDVSS